MCDSSNSILGFLAGAAVGAGLGILFAPDKGSKTRDKIREKKDEIQNDVESSVNEQMAELRQYVSEVVEDVQARIDTDKGKKK